MAGLVHAPSGGRLVHAPSGGRTRAVRPLVAGLVQRACGIGYSKGELGGIMCF